MVRHGLGAAGILGEGGSRDIEVSSHPGQEPAHRLVQKGKRRAGVARSRASCTAQPSLLASLRRSATRARSAQDGVNSRARGRGRPGCRAALCAPRRRAVVVAHAKFFRPTRSVMIVDGRGLGDVVYRRVGRPERDVSAVFRKRPFKRRFDGDGVSAIPGCARVFIGDQDVAGQELRLTQAGAAKVFTDVRSGRSMDRPGLQQLLAHHWNARVCSAGSLTAMCGRADREYWPCDAFRLERRSTRMERAATARRAGPSRQCGRRCAWRWR